MVHIKNLLEVYPVGEVVCLGKKLNSKPAYEEVLGKSGIEGHLVETSSRVPVFVNVVSAWRDTIHILVISIGSVPR